jgi:hypothetical protein
MKKSKQEKSLIVESIFDNISTQKSLDKAVAAQTFTMNVTSLPE